MSQKQIEQLTAQVESLRAIITALQDDIQKAAETIKERHMVESALWADDEECPELMLTEDGYFRFKIRDWATAETKWGWVITNKTDRRALIKALKRVKD